MMWYDDEPMERDPFGEFIAFTGGNCFWCDTPATSDVDVVLGAVLVQPCGPNCEKLKERE